MDGNEGNEVVVNEVRSTIPDLLLYYYIRDPYYIAKFVFEIKALFIDEFDKLSRFSEPATRWHDCRKQRKKNARQTRRLWFRFFFYFNSFFFHVVENNGDRGRLSFERANIMMDFKKIPRSQLHGVTRTTPASSRNDGSTIDHCLVKIAGNDLQLPRRFPREDSGMLRIAHKCYHWLSARVTYDNYHMVTSGWQKCYSGEVSHAPVFAATRNLFAVRRETYNFHRVGCPKVDIIIIMTSKCNWIYR